MATVAKRYIEIELDASQAIKRLKNIDNAAQKSERHLGALGKQAKALGFYMRGAMAYFGTRELFSFADAAVNVNARLSAVTDSAEEAGRAFEDLITIGNKFGVGLEELAASYTKLAVAVPTAEHEQLTQAVATMSHVLSTTGASTQQVNAVLLQMSQALGSAALQGDEFRSVAENAPVLLRAWQEAAGLTAVSFKDLSSNALLTKESFFEFLPAIQRIAKEMVGMEEPPITLGKAFTILRNEGLALFKDVQQGGNAFQILAESVIRVAESIHLLEGPLAVASNLIALMVESAIDLAAELVSVGVAVVNLGASLGSAFSEGENEIEDTGDFIGYMFEVTLPASLRVLMDGARILWATLKAESALTVESVVNYWERLKLSFSLLFAHIEGGFQSAFQYVINIAKQSAAAVGNLFVDATNAGISALNAMGAGIGKVGRFETSTTDVSLDPAQAGKVAALRAEMDKLATSHKTYTDVVKADLAAQREQIAAAGVAYKTKLEDNRITRTVGDTSMQTAKASQELAAGMDEVAKATGGAGKAAKGAAQDLEKMNTVLRDGARAIDEYLLTMEQRIELEKLVGEERTKRQVEMDLMAKSQDSLNKSLEAEAQGKMNEAEAYREVARAWETAIPRAQALAVEYDKLKGAAEESTDVFVKAGDAMKSSFGDVMTDVLDGSMKSWDDYADAVLSAINKIVSSHLMEQFANMMKDITKEGGGILGGLGSLLGPLFGASSAVPSPAFAGAVIPRSTGGPMIPGNAYRVHRDEVVVPQGRADVIPAGDAQSQPAPIVNINFNAAVTGEGLRQSSQSIAAVMGAQIQRALSRNA